MLNFEYHSPAKLIFGENQISKLKDELVERNVKSVLFVYGMGSIKRNGIFDYITNVLDELRIKYVLEGNVKPNPDVSSVRSGINKAISHEVDFIIAAGGGSVIDCAKAIGFGRYYDGDVWDVFINKGKPTKSLPIGVVITLAATGSESNGFTIVSNKETNEKRAAFFHGSIPKFAIIDPTYTLSVNKHHTFAGSIDIIMHVLEQYFANTTDTSTSDYMSAGIIKSVIENTNEIVKGNDNYQVRANLSWASTIAWNKILGVDKQGDWATHRLSYVLTKEYGITHGYALAYLFTSWAKVALKYNEQVMTRRLTFLGKQLFDLTDVNLVLNKLDDVFQSWGAQTRLKSFEKDITPDIIELIDNALALGEVGNVVKIDKEKALEIFNISLGV